MHYSLHGYGGSLALNPLSRMHHNVLQAGQFEAVETELRRLHPRFTEQYHKVIAVYTTIAHSVATCPAESHPDGCWRQGILRFVRHAAWHIAVIIGGSKRLEHHG